MEVDFDFPGMSALPRECWCKSDLRLGYFGQAICQTPKWPSRPWSDGPALFAAIFVYEWHAMAMGTVTHIRVPHYTFSSSAAAVFSRGGTHLLVAAQQYRQGVH